MIDWFRQLGRVAHRNPVWAVQSCADGPPLARLNTPDEVRTLSADRQLLFLAGQRPVIAAKLRYYADREFAGRYVRA